jgi:hypothetical protein
MEEIADGIITFDELVDLYKRRRPEEQGML